MITHTTKALLLFGMLLAVLSGALPGRADVSTSRELYGGGRLSRADDARRVLDSLVSRIVSRGEGEVADLELKPFVKRAEPIMRPRKEGFDSRNIYNMATILEHSLTRMVYRGEDIGEKAGECTGRLGLASSRDGVHFVREEEPVLTPGFSYEKRGIEDPRLVKVGSTYYLTYTAYDGDKARLCLATSKDMRNWKKHGLLFPGFAPTNDWTKSGAILPEKIGSGPHAGRYVMYFGDTDIWMAFSDDLLHWTPVAEPVFRPRKERFDNDLVEPGPPPFMTKYGILMIYNSRSLAGEYTGYNVGAILFDRSDPSRIVARTDRPLLSPTLDWEKHGYVDNVVFAEGLTVRGGAVYLYYGGADRYIGLAVAKARP